RNFDDASYYAILKEHQDKLDRNCSGKPTIIGSLQRCQETIRRSRRSKDPANPIIFIMPDSSAFEPACRGSYESCQRAEVVLRDLVPPKRFQEDSLINSENKPLNIGKQTASAPVQNSHSTPLPAKRLNYGEGLERTKDEGSDANWLGFRTAREQKVLDDLKKDIGGKNVAAGTGNAPSDMMSFRKKTLGGKRTVSSNFVSPLGKSEDSSNGSSPAIPQSLAHLDAKMVEQILGESMHNFKPATKSGFPLAWEDIAGLESAKSTFLEAIIMPLRRPDLFTGVRCPPRGVLLFGPPGTGKTLIAKSIASQAKAKFFSINPSSLTSKWVGEAEKLVKTLFAVAAVHQPAIIFIDEVDSLLSKRSGNENESTLRLKNEFLIHLDGAASNEETRVLVIGATNRPQELDEAVRRRFVRRLYVPLPTREARQKIIEKLIRQVKHSLDIMEVSELAELTEGYSGADVDSLCRYALMAPLRALSPDQMEVIETHQLPPVSMGDFKQALRVISKSVSAEDCQQFVAWNEIYGVKH
ncbi:hypothetical protein KR009_011340, partial [Drosophila setifemur]